MKTYRVSNFTFVENLPDIQGNFEERDITTDVEIRCAQRTKLADSIFIAKLLNSDGADAEQRIKNSVDFVSTFVVDEHLAKRISKDALACLRLFSMGEVQEDLSNFINRALNQTNTQMPEETSRTE